MTRKAAPNNTTIALVEWYWMGHHPSYAVHLALAISKAGMDVVPFCANPADFQRRLNSSTDQSLKHSGKFIRLFKSSGQAAESSGRGACFRLVRPSITSAFLASNCDAGAKAIAEQSIKSSSAASTTQTLSSFVMQSRSSAFPGRASTSTLDSFVYLVHAFPTKPASPAQKSFSPCPPALELPLWIRKQCRQCRSVLVPTNGLSCFLISPMSAWTAQRQAHPLLWPPRSEASPTENRSSAWWVTSNERKACSASPVLPVIPACRTSHFS